MVATILVALAHPDAEFHDAAGPRGEAVLHRDKVAGDQGEQVAGLGMRIGPGDAVAAVAEIGQRAGIAVGQQDRDALLVGGDGDGVARHHVRAVGEVGDAAKPFRLALGEEAAVGDVQPAEFGVFLGRDAGFDRQLAGVRHVGNDQRAVLDAVLVVAERLAIARQVQQRERLAVQPQRRIGGRGGIAAQLEHGGDARRGFVEVEVQLDVIDQEWRWLIVGEADRTRGRLGRDIAGIIEHCRHLWFAGSLSPDATTADASSPGQVGRVAPEDRPAAPGVWPMVSN